jgi:hypothetical protein
MEPIFSPEVAVQNNQVIDKIKNKEQMLVPANEFKWNIKEYCDSVYAGDANTRSIAIGYLTYISKCSIAWKIRV